MIKKRRSLHKPQSTSWGRVAKWYDGVVENKDSFQQKVILPNLLQMMQIKPGDRILDIACGNGFFSRAFFKQAEKVHVFGTDISKELIDLARKVSHPNIFFEPSPADKQSFLKTGCMNKAVIVLALQNIERFEQTLTEARRILKKDGKLFIVLNHPSFRIPGQSSWGFDGIKKQYRRIDAYLSTFTSKIQMHPGDDPKEITTSFHRPLQTYIKALSKAGFQITNLEEWISHKKSTSGPRAKAENNARQEIPMFMAIEAVAV